MPGKAAKVVISERQEAILAEFSDANSEPLWLRRRARIILQAFTGQRNEEIAKALKLHPQQIGLWRRRWQKSWNSLTALECSDPDLLRAAVRDVLRAPRGSSAQKGAHPCEPS